MRTILHVDMDAFYASVEQRDRPELKGQPVIVGADPKEGTGRGVVSACSYEAREFGIHSALPISHAWRRCPQGRYVRPRFERYQEVSGQIMDVFRRYTDMIEPLSIDEAFLDITGSIALMGPPEQIARDIKIQIKKETDLTASVGLAPNKFLAKIASDLEKPDGMVIVPVDDVEGFLGPLPISKIWGVGPKTAARIRKLGVETVAELAAVPPATLEHALGSTGLHLWNLAHGNDDRPVVSDSAPKSVSSETTFAEDTDDEDKLRSTLRRLSDRVGARLRTKRYRTRTVTLKLRYADFRTYNRQVSLPEPTDDGDEIFRHARNLFGGFRLEQRVRLIGVGTANLVGHDERAPQLDLFASEPENNDKLSHALDEIHKRFGDHSLHRASDL